MIYISVLVQWPAGVNRLVNTLHTALLLSTIHSFSLPRLFQTCLLNMTSSTPDHNKHLSSSNIIAVGTTGLIYALDNDRVLKRCPQVPDPFIHQTFSIELRVYDRLGKHPRIATVYEVTEKIHRPWEGGVSLSESPASNWICADFIAYQAPMGKREPWRVYAIYTTGTSSMETWDATT